MKIHTEELQELDRREIEAEIHEQLLQDAISEKEEHDRPGAACAKPSA